MHSGVTAAKLCQVHSEGETRASVLPVFQLLGFVQSGCHGWRFLRVAQLAAHGHRCAAAGATPELADGLIPTTITGGRRLRAPHTAEGARAIAGTT